MRKRVGSGRFEELGPLQPPGLAPRSLRIFVPEDGEQIRPALFVLDGEDVFSSPRAPRGGWGLDDAVRGLDLRRSIAPLVVAIPNPDRDAELTPWPIAGRGGRGWPMLEWIARTAVPAVRARYAIPEGALGAVLGGASWGGLCALCGHFAFPEVFGGALALSPGLWVG